MKRFYKLIKKKKGKMNYKLIVNELKDSSFNILTKCINEPDILKQCILCKRFLSSNQWSMILEKSIKKKFNIGKSLNNISGDGRVNSKNIEIKVSLGDKKGQFNFVQLRPGHSIDYYLFLTYNLFEDDLGKIYWFLIPPEKLIIFPLF